MAKGTEGNHVLMRVERHTMESSRITELRVDRDCITCTKRGVNSQECSQTSLFTLTCVRIPHVRQPVFTARENKLSTRRESAADPLSVVGGSYVFLHSQADGVDMKV